MPPAPAAPPPASPPPAPAPAAAPAAQPVTMPAPAPQPTAPDPDKFFNDLDDAPPPAPDPKPGAEPAKEPKGKMPAPKPGGQPEPKSEPEPAGVPVELKKMPKEFRKEYEHNLSELKTKNAEVVRLLQQLEAAKSQPQVNPAEVEALTERLVNRDREYQELLSEIKVLRYERSPEYKSKFLEPYDAAKKKAFDAVQQLVIRHENKETGQVDERKATVQDFLAVATLPEGAAWQRARQIFGEDAHLVMRHYDRLTEIAEQADGEIQRYRKEAEERDKSDTARQATERQAIEAMNHKADEGWAKRSKWFAPIEGDDEGNTLLQKGFERVDADRQALNPVQRAIHQSWIRHAAAAYPRLKTKMDAYEARIADLEQKLQGFQESEPGPGKTTPAARPDTGVAPDAMTDPNAPWNK